MSEIPSDHGLQICQRAIGLANNDTQTAWELSELLDQVQKDELWRSVKATSFKHFVQEFLKLSDSRSRQLVKTRRLCDKLKIPKEQMLLCGWSKLAEVEKVMTEENKEAVLADVSQLSLADLREKYRAPKAQAELQKEKPQAIVLTAEIQAALNQAARFTGSPDLQTNLEFVARKFGEQLSLMPEFHFKVN
jgi:hypothetical protein